MNRCDVCGRSLLGLRADHPVHCRIASAIREPDPEPHRVPAVLVVIPKPLVGDIGMIAAMVEANNLEALGMNPRTVILEGSALDPFAAPEVRDLVIAEGPAQRGERSAA